MFKKLRCTHEWHVVSQYNLTEDMPGCWSKRSELYCPKCRKLKKNLTDQETDRLMNISKLHLDKVQAEKDRIADL